MDVTGLICERWRCCALAAMLPLAAACQPSPGSPPSRAAVEPPPAPGPTQTVPVNGSIAPADRPDRPAEEPLEQRQLRDLLPAKLMGCQRTSVKSESTGNAGFGVSLAEAEFEASGAPLPAPRKLFVRLTDGKRLGSLVGATLAMAEVDIDKATDDGHEKTTRIRGRRAYERYSSGQRRGEIHVVVADRFIVELAAEEVALEELRAALEELDVSRLEALSRS